MTQAIEVMDEFGHRELSGMAWDLAVLTHSEAGDLDQDSFGEVQRRDMFGRKQWCERKAAPGFLDVLRHLISLDHLH